jgi:phospholipase/carboxylesterase
VDPSGKRLRKATPEELQGAFDKMSAFIEEAISEYNCDPDLVIGVGFSQGAALIGSLSLNRPGLLTGVALLAGIIPRVLQDEHQLIAPEVLKGEAKLARYFMNNGTKDRIVTVERGRESRDKLIELGAEVEFHEEAVTHKVGSQGREALSKWAQSFKKA